MISFQYLNKRRGNMAKPENLTKTILHALSAVFGALILGFLALPYIAIKAVQALGVPAMNKTGYDFLDFSTPNPTSEQTFCAVVVLLLVIFACVLIVSSILTLLCDFGIIKNEKVSKIMKLLSLISAVVVLVLTVLNFVACSNLVSATNKPFQVAKLSPASMGTIGLVLNLICGAGATASSAYNNFKK